MALVMGALEQGPVGRPAVSVTHSCEQTGDLMRDPGMCLVLRNGELDCCYYRNDYVGLEQWSRNLVCGQYVQVANLHAQHQRFAKVWDNSLRCQGFAEAYEQQLTRHT
jgi:hypothetical protein